MVDNDNLIVRFIISHCYLLLLLVYYYYDCCRSHDEQTLLTTEGRCCCQEVECYIMCLLLVVEKRREKKKNNGGAEIEQKPTRSNCNFARALANARTRSSTREVHTDSPQGRTVWRRLAHKFQNRFLLQPFPTV